MINGLLGTHAIQPLSQTGCSLRILVCLVLNIVAEVVSRHVDDLFSFELSFFVLPFAVALLLPNKLLLLRVKVGLTWYISSSAELAELLLRMRRDVILGMLLLRLRLSIILLLIILLRTLLIALLLWLALVIWRRGVCLRRVLLTIALHPRLLLHLLLLELLSLRRCNLLLTSCRCLSLLELVALLLSLRLSIVVTICLLLFLIKSLVL